MALTDAYADRGYAFADVTPTVSIDQATRLVSLSFTTRPGPKVYTLDVLILSAMSAREDQVIRREMRASMKVDSIVPRNYNAHGSASSNLQYFEEVKIDTKRGKKN